MRQTYTDLPMFAWICIGVALLVQGTWLFLDARRRQFHPWLWGLWGLLTGPAPLVVYLVITRVVMKKRNV